MILYAIPVSTYGAHPVVRQVTDESRRATLAWMGTD